LVEVDTLLANATAANELPGLVATITVGQTQAWYKGYGKRDARKASQPPTGVPAATDLVWIASITKTFTSLLLYMLRDKGVVSLDDPVAKFFPAGQFGYKTPWLTSRQMTLRQLASHTSGLPREIPFVSCSTITSSTTTTNASSSTTNASSTSGECTPTEADYLEAVKTSWLVVPPGSRFHYSNLGFALLGRALAHAVDLNTTSTTTTTTNTNNTKTTYEALVQKMILTPLGMSASTFFNQFPSTLSTVAVGLTPDGKAGIEYHRDDWAAPCGGLLSTADDMAKYMMLYGRKGLMQRIYHSTTTANTNHRTTPPPTPLVDGATITELLQPVAEMRDGSSAIGLPWEFKYSSGLWYKSKQGGDPGYRTVLFSLSLAANPP
jgi:CubicO group peptidase (beta-lactamase class C family)